MKTGNVFYFSLASAFYAVRFNDIAIFLNTHDAVYLNIIQDMVHYLSLICVSKFSRIQASLINHKKIYCPVWVATFVFLGLEKKEECSASNSNQAYQFYVRVRSELNGRIVHDVPRISQMLSIISRESHIT